MNAGFYIIIETGVFFYFKKRKKMPISFVILKKEYYEKHKLHSEILHKEKRPHMVLLVECLERKFAIPLRSNAVRMHARVVPIAFYLLSSERAKKSKKGRCPALDYVKALLVETCDIERFAKIDRCEFNEVMANIDFIKDSFEKYLKFYMENFNDELRKNLPEIKYSTLKYFFDGKKFAAF